MTSRLSVLVQFFERSSVDKICGLFVIMTNIVIYTLRFSVGVSDFVVSEHITSPSSVLMPVKELAVMCRQHDVITVVDGAHVVGQMPLDVEDLGVDFYTGNKIFRAPSFVCSRTWLQ